MFLTLRLPLGIEEENKTERKEIDKLEVKKIRRKDE